MARLLTCCFLFIFSFSFGQKQNQNACKIEFYFLKIFRPNLDKTKNLSAEFSVSKSDLEDTAFIKDSEIISYRISRDTIINAQRKKSIAERHQLKVRSKLIQKINNLNIPLSGGRQFALLVNGEISEWITALSTGRYIEIIRKLPDYNSANDFNDPRQNQLLLDCLNSTNRLIKNSN